VNIAFRTDASLLIGMGHVTRCLTLAEALRDQGAKILFVCREHDGHLCDLISSHDFEVARLPLSRHKEAESTTWLGATWQEDAKNTREVLESWNAKLDWLVVDHYQLDRRWEGVLRPMVEHIMVIDDLADRTHDCDLLLDQNLVAGKDTRYTDKVPASCILLLGPKYALLQPDYAVLHDRIPPRVGPIRRILIFFSGADSENLTGKTLSAFLSLHKPEIQVDVIVTSSNPFIKEIRQQVAEYDNIYLYSDLPTLAPLMAKADLAIGAGGTTSWERLCLGLPTLVITLAENQVPIADSLERREMIRWLGHYNEVSNTQIYLSIKQLVEDGIEREWSKRCLELVDGRGINRVCSAMTVDSLTPLCVRRALKKDEVLLLEWANDPVTRQNAFNVEYISEEAHKKWFQDRLSTPDSCIIYIVESKADEVPIGQVRFERNRNNVWEIDYVLSPIYRGRGLGKALLGKALDEMSVDNPQTLIIGKVKESNIPSRRVFEALGFQLSGENNIGAVEYSFRSRS
jgi:UDP-2,4-diacetamido-2,4,6-trideoxy-beta-L-altropyranose hydrolase